MLQAQLSYDHPAEVARLHRTCAAWYAEAGRPAEAVSHAITARDWGFATRLLVDDLVVPRLLAHGSDSGLRGLRSLPRDLGGVEAALLRVAVVLGAGGGPSPADLSSTREALHTGDRPALRASAALTCLAAATASGAEPTEILSLTRSTEVELAGIVGEDRQERRDLVAVLAGSRALAVLRGDGPLDEAT